MTTTTHIRCVRVAPHVYEARLRRRWRLWRWVRRVTGL